MKPLFYPVVLWCVCLCMGLNTQLYAQSEFSPSELQNPEDFRSAVPSHFKIIEKKKVNPAHKEGKIWLENDLRSSTYRQPDLWKSQIGSLTPTRVDIVFSKYPIRNGTYKMHMPLLCNRLKNLFEIDPSLNSPKIEWRIVLQTIGETDEEVDALFHGVVIHYPTDEKPRQGNLADKSSIKTRAIPEPVNVSLPVVDAQLSEAEESEQLEFVLGDVEISTTTKMEIAALPIEKQAKAIADELEEKLKAKPEKSIRELTPEEVAAQKKRVKRYVKTYGKSSDKTVYEVLDRHPEWKKSLVVADWTGSMYQYGAQALLWHIEHLDQSGLSVFTLFNDGDSRSTKPIGSTKGIYHEKADNVEKLIDLYNLVMMKGGGGDWPENDVEAILEAVNLHPDHQEIILVADNNACVRDIELAEFIEGPVRIILCGYSNGTGVNPHYVELAKITGGSIHTIEDDIDNVTAEGAVTGKLLATGGKSLKMGKHYCDINRNVKEAFFNGKIYTDLEEANEVASLVKNLDLSKNKLEKIPREVRKLNQLRSLSLSQNEITKISPKLAKLKYIKQLDLSKNQLAELPEEVWKLPYLNSLDLSHNQLSIIPDQTILLKVETLNLSNNKLTSLPKNFGMARKLKTLNLSQNQLESLPSSFGNFRKLEELDLSNNQLETLPKRFKYLKKLKTLDLRGNNIKKEQLEEYRKLLPNTLILF